MEQAERIRKLAALAVRTGANVQPGQIVVISTEPGKEELARAVAEQAYLAGAKFVEARSFDPHLKRLRALHADPDTLEYVPPWLGEQVLALGEHRAARITLYGVLDPRLMDGIDPERLGRDMLPRVKESTVLQNERTTNWNIIPAPTPGWASVVYPELGPEAALEQLWQDVEHVCRLDEPDPAAAWQERLDRLVAVVGRLDALDLDELHFTGPGTDLRVGLLPSGRWQAARFATVDGIVHSPNLPTEEVFTSPDPARVEGHVRSTRPLLVNEVTVSDLEVRFAGGRAVQIDASEGAETLRSMAARDEGAARLGEVALVDRESRIGQLGRVFSNTLLDENAASHIALGAGFLAAAGDETDRTRINQSEIHVDFMIGSPEVDVAATTRDDREIPLLRGGAWQI
ncbi:MAG TPA: aminopeptidase [Solirubrobacteraceae bacterium]|nr:aminopeptidase [Solirubrobacteraceae bacterium]